MAHPKDEEIYPEGTIVRLLETGEFARIVRRVFLTDGVRNFLHYEAQIEGRDNTGGVWILYHDRVELEALP